MVSSTRAGARAKRLEGQAWRLCHMRAKVVVPSLCRTFPTNPADVYTFKNAPLAQSDRASVFGTEGWGFESLKVRHD